MASFSPLRGIRVVDFSTNLPGPYCTRLLHNLGAEVIKVEPPGGDPGRALAGNLFAAANRGKRSIALDLKDDADRDTAHTIVRGADVLVESFRPGVMTRLGMGPDLLREINPRLVYCSISGYGAHGEDNLRPGHDVTYLAAAGILSIMGQWLDQEPFRAGIPLADVAASMNSALMILAALMHRRQFDCGTFLDVSMVDAAHVLGTVRTSSEDVNSTAIRSHLIPTNDVFRAADGRFVALGVVEQHFWTAFANVMATEVPAILDERFEDADGRAQHGDELHALVTKGIAQRDSQTWFEELARHDVPVEVVRTMAEAKEAARTRERAAADGSVAPVLVDGAAPAHPSSEETVPALDADRDELLERLCGIVPPGPS